MKNKVISEIKPLENYVLQVDFVSGSRVLLDLSDYIECLRFRPLKDEAVWRSAVTNGMFVRFGDVELSHNEIFEIIEAPRKQNRVISAIPTTAEKLSCEE